MIRFTCDCGRVLQAREEDAGKKAQCPACGAIVPVPAEAAEQRERTRPEAPREDRPPRRREDEEDRVRPERRDRDRDRGRYADEEDDWDRDRDRDRGGRRRRGRDRDRERDKEKSGATVVIVVLACVFGGLLVLGGLSWLLLMPAVSRVREAAAKTHDANNFKLLAIGLLNFQDNHQKLPAAAAFRDRDGKPLLSWRVALLPFIEQGALYNQFKLDEPWDSPNNRALLARMPLTFARPGEEPGADGLTHYQVFTGKGALFEEPPENLVPNPNLPPGMLRKGSGLGQIPDGTSNTIMIAEAKNAVPWTKPADLEYDPNGPLPGLGGRFSAGFNAAMADGSVRFVRYSNAESTVRALITRNGGEVLPPDW